METLLDILRKSESFLAGKGVPEPRLDAEHLLAAALSCRRMDLYLQFDRPMTEDLLSSIRPLVSRRGKREPLSHILGKHPFHDLELGIGPGALIPRPETEELVEKAAALQPRPKTILDLGTGSGAIALALKSRFPEADATATDCSKEALSIARANGERLGLRVRWLQTDWFDGLSGTFDLIVANPPYLTDEEWQSAAQEVRDHEPRSALVAGADGLSDLCRIVSAAPAFLRPRGILALETGIAHQAPLLRLGRETGFAEAWGEQDLQGRDRFVFCRKA